MERFFQRIGNELDKEYDFNSRMAYQQKINVIFNDIKKFVDRALQANAYPDQLDEIVEKCGWIFKYCSRCLYVRAKVNNTLRQLADSILFATETNSKILQSSLNHLPSFFCGLFKLDVNNDTVVRELISALIRLFLTKYATITGGLEALLVGNILENRVSSMTVSFICRMLPSVRILIIHQHVISSFMWCAYRFCPTFILRNMQQRL